MPRLNDRQRALLGEYLPETNLSAALALAKEGWHVFPLTPGSKLPMISKKQGGRGAHDGTVDPDVIRSWWTRHPKAGIGANLGDNRIAFDFDFNHGAQELGSFPPTRTHYTGRGGGNKHLIYRIEPGSLASLVQSGTNVLGPGIDIRAGRGSYIVMPPTPHEDTGVPYSIDQVLRKEHTLTDEELQAIWDEAGVALSAKSRGARKGLSVVSGAGNSSGVSKSGRKALSELLADPPSEGGRNDWLSRVAGHHAKQIRHKDAYEEAVRAANLMLSTPLEEDEVSKTLESIWETEQTKPQREPMEENGWLTGNKRKLFCQTSHKEGDETVYDQQPYADFDLEAKGVAVDDMHRQMYWVRIYSPYSDPIDTTVPGELLGNENATKAWLASRGFSVDPPFNATPKTAPATRLLRYLKSQKPPRVHIVPTLGWDERSGYFVTHDGVISAKGFKTKEDAGMVADPRLLERDVAPYSYGFERSQEEARKVLQEVLTFQDEVLSSVFGAWWAACFLKPQLQDRTALFPFFGVEAASESGKTNGFFDLMVALNGNTRGQVVPTRPVLRDYASANRNGIVWADDLDSLEPYGELLRASTSNGTASKMGQDRSGVVNTQVVSPILITGEALGFGTQKALVDRSVLMSAPSPKNRRSRHDPKKLQWQDVVALKDAYPDSLGGLSVLSGWYVRQAMQEEQKVLGALRSVAGTGFKGRAGDKLAVLLAGSQLLDSLVGHPGAYEGQGEHFRRVAAWAKSQGQGLEQDNTLTTRILPWALSTFNMPTEAEAGADSGRFAGIATPAFRKTDRLSNELPLDGGGSGIWYSPVLLAEAWARDRGGRVQERTESVTALTQQAQAIGGTRKAVRLQGSSLVKKYRELPAEYAAVVLRRVSEDV